MMKEKEKTIPEVGEIRKNLAELSEKIHVPVKLAKKMKEELSHLDSSFVSLMRTFRKRRDLNLKIKELKLKLDKINS